MNDNGRDRIGPEDRRRVVEHLTQYYVADILDQESFEDRVTLANRATEMDALHALLGDLPALRPEAGSDHRPDRPTEQHAATTPTVNDDSVRDSERFVAILGGAVRKGWWRPARRMEAVAIFGGVELDFREAELPAGITELSVVAVFGGAEITVPEGVRVEVNGSAILGGFENSAQSAPEGAPTLRVEGFALFGGVEVRTRALKKKRR